MGQGREIFPRTPHLVIPSKGRNMAQGSGLLLNSPANFRATSGRSISSLSLNLPTCLLTVNTTGLSFSDLVKGRPQQDIHLTKDWEQQEWGPRGSDGEPEQSGWKEAPASSTLSSL